VRTASIGSMLSKASLYVTNYLGNPGQTRKAELQYNLIKGTGDTLDPCYPFNVIMIRGKGSFGHEVYINSYASVEAAREDFPNVHVMPAQANFIEDLRCPNCGSDEYDEGDCKDFGDEERCSFLCQKCQAHWFQWNRIERIPCRIEYDGVDYDLPESEADRIQKAAQKLFEAAKKAVACPALNMEDLETADVDAVEFLRTVIGAVKQPTKST